MSSESSIERAGLKIVKKRRKLTLELFRVVAYDIPEDKKRVKLHRELKGLLNHVQYSVFEGMLDHKHTIKVEQIIQELINPDEDTVRLYSLCQTCAKGTKVFGGSKLYIDEGFYII